MAERSTSDLETNEPIEAIGVNLAERVYAGLVVGHKLQATLLSYPSGPAPADEEDDDSLVELPAEGLVSGICDLVLRVGKGHESKLKGVGVALPGLIRNGVVEEAPNIPQLKGVRIQDLVAAALESRGLKIPVTILNDADAVAAGLASQHGKLEQQVRVWSIGTGIGYGCYPFMDGVWEGGHTVVTLDDKENYCGCGGRGHLEGIMGHRAMRLRFLDMEPEEVFEAAERRSDARCVEFKHLWHKALGRRHGERDSSGGRAQVLYHRIQRALSRPQDAEGLSAPDGKDEPVAELLSGDCRGQPDDACGGRGGCGGAGVDSLLERARLSADSVGSRRSCGRRQSAS